MRREGRITPAQAAALESLWPRYGIDYRQETLDLDQVFGRRAPRVLEIGFGNGDALLAAALATPGQDFFGIEVHRPGVGSLLRRAAQDDIDNLRVSTHDAVEVVNWQFAPGSLAEVRIYFPDPWPKKRHHKRRIVQPDFVATLAERLEDGGQLHLATDWEPYAEWMLEVLQCCDALENLARDAYSPRPDTRPETRFERRGVGLGHVVRDLVFKRRARG